VLDRVQTVYRNGRYHGRMLNRSKSAVWIGTVIVALLILQQAPFLIRGDYSRRVAWESTSPDQRYRLEVRTQANFPALYDPSAMAYIGVIDTRTGRAGARTILPVHRLSDLKRPTVQWSTKEVQVVDFDQSQPASVRLLLSH
jgi:hypothetical protein